MPTTEAEYVALSTALTERIWLKPLLVDMNVEYGNILMYEDNKNAILISKNNDNILSINILTIPSLMTRLIKEKLE